MWECTGQDKKVLAYLFILKTIDYANKVLLFIVD